MGIELRSFVPNDIELIVSSFVAADWPKPRSTFAQYLEEQNAGHRKVWLAYYDEKFAGYVTITWQSRYKPFRQNDIPEIMDLNVLPDFRYKGIGTALLQADETEAYARHAVVGLGVGLYPDYGDAQRLYVKRGYVPDGLGVTYNYERVQPGDSVNLDDDLVLWFLKRKA
jgi:GNAT superfamily N-acetyltransferase